MSHLGYYQFTSSVDGDTDADISYYNASIINNRTNEPYDRSVDPQVRFVETRDTPLLQDASKFHFSIIRFVMSGPNRDLPLFIPVIRTGVDNPTNDINLTIYSVNVSMTLTYPNGAGPAITATVDSTQPIIYAPETQDPVLAPPPLPASVAIGTQDISTRYYWVYTYSHFLDLVNTAFQACMTDLQSKWATAWTTAGGVGAAPTIQTAAPKLTYTPTTNLFTLYTDAYGFGGSSRISAGSATGDENAQLYFNSNMYGLFANFNNTYVALSDERTNLIYTGPVGPYGGLSAGVPQALNVQTVGTKHYWVQTQDFESTSSLWSPIESIVFTTTLLPLVSESSGDPVRFGQSTVGEYNNNQSGFVPIVTDIALPLQNAADYKSLIYYAPQAQYRLASFTRSKQPINNIDIQVFWKSRLDGQLYPIQMFNCSSVSIKILFQRRGLYDYPHPQKMGVNT